MKHLKKRHYLLISLALILFIALFFLSTFIKNYINNNSKELLGRKVVLNELSINYLRVAVRASDLMVYEANDVDTFAGFREFYVNFDPLKILRNSYSFSAVTLDSLFVNVIQDDDGFNFDDIIPAQDSSHVEEADTTATDPFRFAVHNINFKHGFINYFDKTVDNELKLEDISLQLPLIAWDSESSDVGVDFRFGRYGKVYINSHVDQLDQTYHVDFKVDSLDLSDISSYVENTIDAGGIKGFVSTDLKINGSLKNTMDVTISGNNSLQGFHLWDLENKDVFSVQNVSYTIKSFDLAKQNFNISDVSIDNPVITASLYKDMSNIERMLQPVMISDSTQQDSLSHEVPKDTTSVNFSIDKFDIKNGEIIFTDNTLYRPFVYDFKEINVSMTDIKDDAVHIPLKFAINMNDQGKLSGESVINMVEPYNLNMKAEIDRLRLMSFSPYSEYYIARPITQGDITYDLSIDMSPTLMTNNNDIVIKELEIGSKTQEEPQVKAPVKLGLYLMKDPKDVISIDMPVEGNPSDPNFSVSKLIWKAFSNLLVKVAASPFNALGNLVGTRPEELENIPMPYAQDSLLSDQQELLDKIAHILTKKPQLIFSFEQQTDPDEEKSVLAVKMAKTQMLTEKLPLITADEIAEFHVELAKLEDTDEDFIKYLRKNVENSAEMDVTTASLALIGDDRLDDAFRKLLINRNEFIHYYLTEEKGVDPASIEVNTADLRNLPDELKSCNYKLEVSIK